MTIKSMQEKTVVITGAGSGIGLETSVRLALMGASLVLIDLHRERGEAALVRIRQSGPAPRFFIADLSVQADVRRVADEILASTQRIDVLVNNVGAWFDTRQMTADGLERTFALNHLSYFLLTHLLLSRIITSAPARIISVSSMGHREASLDFDDLQSEKNYSRLEAYCRSKLANVLFTRALARRLQGSGVTANCLHPGIILSHFFDNGTLDSSAKAEQETELKKAGFLPPEAGARTPVYLASSPEVEGINGQYFDDCKIAQPSLAAQDDIAAEQLWAASLRLTGLDTHESSTTPS